MTKLSWSRHDIEHLCGFKSKKFTGVNFLFTFIAGLLFTAAFYLILLPFTGKEIQLIDMFFHGGTKDRSSLPYYTMFFAFWAMAILIVKNFKINLQRKALQLKILPDEPNFVLTAVTAAAILENISEKVDIPSRFILLDRIDRAVSNLKNLGDVTSIAECLNNQAQNDDNYLSSSYTVLKGFIWAIPVLGFIGTVVGLSQAVGGFGAVVAGGADIAELKNALGGVTGGLAVAFETTLIALVMALIIQLFMTFTQNKEEMFLDECADFCHKNIISKMKNPNLSGQ